ncbi:MAG: CBS domain-containing protein [Candidatus Diapherotrites archaeon]|uniref:CBS domain-containing protein n=1 Tax=Candidatus Iainarchaeum sp. TaxID=3101447 RepID=A0A8T4KPW5_9ARCH|nr:CBS domain-containing protein [Candidatus Diapherotrites archaeon]
MIKRVLVHNQNMLPELTEIKLRRMHLGLTQTQLAKLAHVSQSLIAKIESGNLVPGYENAKKLLNALDSAKRTDVKTAKDIMRKHVIDVKANEKIKDVIIIMRRHSISQLPVVDSGKVVGLISEKRIIEAGQDYSSRQKSIAELPVKQIMEDSPPMIQENSPQEMIAAMLEHYPAVLVAKHGGIAGIITKTDLLGAIVAGKRA